MTVIKVILGILGMGVVVFFHELGHFIMARLCGVGVEEFSIGWGPKLFSKRHGKTIYSISALPIGGFCRMSGEESYTKALQEGLEDFPKEPGTYYAAKPWKRILIAFGGPAMNVILAFVLYFLISIIGYSSQSWNNTIILASDFDNRTYPANSAGLMSGDKIIKINNKEVSSYSQIQEEISLNAKHKSILTVQRDTQTLELEVTPELDKETGAGRLGIYPFIEPLIDSIAEQSPAKLAGLESGDVITSINDIKINHVMEIEKYLPQASNDKLQITYLRNGKTESTTLIIPYIDGKAQSIGINWKAQSTKIRAANFFDAIAMGFEETSGVITSTYKGLASLFMGVNIMKAVSGPARITWMIGSVATSGFSQTASDGIYMTFSILAFLSIALFAMNLLPIPLLDGGSILLYIIEMIRRKAMKIKTVYRYQTIGMVFVLVLMVVATMSDLLFFIKK